MTTVNPDGAKRSLVAGSNSMSVKGRGRFRSSGPIQPRPCIQMSRYTATAWRQSPDLG